MEKKGEAPASLAVDYSWFTDGELNDGGLCLCLPVRGELRMRLCSGLNMYRRLSPADSGGRGRMFSSQGTPPLRLNHTMPVRHNFCQGSWPSSWQRRRVTFRGCRCFFSAWLGLCESATTLKSTHYLSGGLGLIKKDDEQWKLKEPQNWSISSFSPISPVNNEHIMKSWRKWWSHQRELCTITPEAWRCCQGCASGTFISLQVGPMIAILVNFTFFQATTAASCASCRQTGTSSVMHKSCHLLKHLQEHHQVHYVS